jgi:hypothetical protein
VSVGPRSLHRERCGGLAPQAAPSSQWAAGDRTTLIGTAAAGGRRSEDSMTIHRNDDGITTAEYAVGTAAGAGLAGLLFKLLTGSFGEQLLRTLFDHVLSLLGIG